LREQRQGVQRKQGDTANNRNYSYVHRDFHSFATRACVSADRKGQDTPTDPWNGQNTSTPYGPAWRGAAKSWCLLNYISGSAAGWGAGSRRRPPLRRDRKFESVSLQRGVSANLIADDLRMALIDLRPYSCASQRHRRKWDREFESGLLQGRVHCEIRSRSRGSSYRVGPT
jgi:hypothetical protein